MYRPIKSFGVILYFTSQPSNNIGGRTFYLLCKRRDTYQYQNIIRGKWVDEEELKSLIRKISKEERDRLSNNNFKDVWDDFWPDHTSEAYSRRYEELKEKFEICKTILNSFEEISEPVDSMWGFPKGKKNGNCEHNLDAAMREFSEETKISLEDIQLMEYPAFKENYIGTDGKRYESLYYPAYYKPAIPFIPSPNTYEGRIRTYSHSDEIDSLRWCSILESKPLLTSARYEMLETLSSNILKIPPSYYSNKNVGRLSFQNNIGERSTYETCYRRFKKNGNIDDKNANFGETISI